MESGRRKVPIDEQEDDEDQYWEQKLQELDNNDKSSELEMLKPGQIIGSTYNAVNLLKELIHDYPIVNNKIGGFDFFQNVLKSPKTVCAPMVHQSELPFRMLCRKYNTDLCYTPMFHSKLFATEQKYRDKHFSTVPEDRPLVVQFCANDPYYLLKAAKLVEKDCDAVDINFGCPQRIAKAGNYGAFLMEKPELQYNLIKTLHDHLNIPVFCKIRVYPEYERTLEYARMCERAGAQLITVHGRTREMKGCKQGLADWEQIKKLKEDLTVPVISNGNIRHLEDVKSCLDFTKADGVMSAEGLLKNPALFAGVEKPTFELAQEYIEMCEKYPTQLIWVRNHICKMFVKYLSGFEQIRDRIFLCEDLEALKEFVGLVEKFEKTGNLDEFKIERPKKIRPELADDVGDLFSSFQELEDQAYQNQNTSSSSEEIKTK